MMELKPCPKCTDTWIYASVGDYSSDYETNGYKVGCRCGYAWKNNDWKPTKEEAITDWNKRIGVKTCGQCKHFIGCGDWNLCCDIKHPTPKEKEQGLDFYWGHLCYEDTKACDMFEEDKADE